MCAAWERESCGASDPSRISSVGTAERRSPPRRESPAAPSAGNPPPRNGAGGTGKRAPPPPRELARRSIGGKPPDERGEVVILVALLGSLAATDVRRGAENASPPLHARPVEPLRSSRIAAYR